MKYRIKGVDLIMTTVLIKNVRLISDKEPGLGNIFIRHGKIDSIFKDNESSKFAADLEIDGHSQMPIPGMIDVHIHGADGFDMMDGTLQSVEAVSKACARTGCTSFLAISVSSSLEDLIHMISSVSQVIGRGGLEMVAFLKERGIIVSVAHSDATYEEAKEAFRCGASHVTHCFNGMRPIHHRDPGKVIAAFEENHVSVQSIVTDALQAMGMGDGTYLFGGHEVKVSQGVATLADGTLASSIITMNKALEKAVLSGIPLRDAVVMATQTPADILGLSSKGRIEAGADADLVLMNEYFEVLWTIVNGNVVYRRND
jgi:N-acetylglucosamine-6-phosphate deacetylase